MPLLRTLTLGCKVNQYETEYLRQALARAGYRDAAEGQRADLCLVNTCTVTLEGDYKSRKLIRQLARENPDAEIVVTGCYAARAPQEVAALPGVVEVLDKQALPEWLARRGVAALPVGIESFDRLHRAYVKVQDGCRMACSYCIVPQVRPTLASRPLEETLAEIRGLVARGHREIVLTGIHLGHYGVERSQPGLQPGSQTGHGGRRLDLAGLLRAIVALEGDFRVRLSSLEPSEASDALIAVAAEHPDRVCPHFHIAVQSGSETVLRRMNRPGGVDALIARCERIAQSLDTPALSTDVIVGFPGETDAEFDQTCRVVEQIGFSRLHIFRYSARQGTPAATMPNPVPAPVKKERAERLAKIGDRLRDAFLARLVGRTLRVLVEGRARDEQLVGTCDRYTPVEFAGGDEWLDRFAPVRAASIRDGRLLGTR